MVKQTFFDNERYNVVDRFPNERIGQTTVELWPPGDVKMYLGLFYADAGYGHGYQYACYAIATSVEELNNIMVDEYPDIPVKMEEWWQIKDAYVTFSYCEECCSKAIQQPILVARVSFKAHFDNNTFYRHIPIGPLDSWVNRDDFDDEMLHIVFKESYYIPYASALGTCTDCFERFGVEFWDEKADPGDWCFSPYPTI
jgi:hypothetical protein